MIPPNCTQNWTLLNSRLVLFGLILFTISTRTLFGRPTEDQSAIEIDQRQGGNAHKNFYSYGSKENYAKRLPVSSESSYAQSSETEVVREVPNHVETLYYKGHPVKANEESNNNKKFARFSEAYLDVVKEMQRICGDTKLRHRKKRVNRGSGKKSKQAANQDLLSVLCQNPDSTEESY